jgi:hypothetical protein
MAPIGDSTGLSKTKSSKPKHNIVSRTNCSSEWTIQTLGGVMTHEVPLPGAPTVRV